MYNVTVRAINLKTSHPWLYSRHAVRDPRRGRCVRNFAHDFAAISAFADRLDAILHSLAPWKGVVEISSALHAVYRRTTTFLGGWEFLGALHWATPPVYWKCKDDITGKSCVEYIRVRKYSGCLRKRNSMGSEQISITRVFPSLVHWWKKRKKVEPKRFFEAQTTGSSGNWYVKKMVTENISLPREELMRNRRKILRPRVYPYIHRVARETATRPDVNHQYDYARIS